MDDRLITSTMQFDDNEVENVLRPKTMSSFVGQDKIKNNLEIYIQAAKSRDEALDHLAKQLLHTLLQQKWAVDSL